MLAESKADTLLLGGDLTIARHFSGTIAKIRMAFPGNVVLVAGNHDYYGSGIDDFREKLKEIDGSLRLSQGAKPSRWLWDLESISAGAAAGAMPGPELAMLLPWPLATRSLSRIFHQGES